MQGKGTGKSHIQSKLRTALTKGGREGITISALKVTDIKLTANSELLVGITVSPWAKHSTKMKLSVGVSVCPWAKHSTKTKLSVGITVRPWAKHSTKMKSKPLEVR